MDRSDDSGGDGGGGGEHHRDHHHPPRNHFESQCQCRMRRTMLILAHRPAPVHLFYDFAIIGTHHPLADDDDAHDHGDYNRDHNRDDHHSHRDRDLPWCSDCWIVEAGVGLPG